MTPEMIIKRNVTGKDGTFGVFIDAIDPQNKVAFALSVEPEWKGNQNGISCIPDGTYLCKRRMYHRRGYEVFEITDVPGRADILIHKGNTEDDTKGCVLPGEQFESLGGKSAVLASGKGFDELMKRNEGRDEFILDIEWCCDPDNGEFC